MVLLKTALRPDFWPHPVDLKLGFLDKILMTVNTTNQLGNVCTALELLTYFLTVLKKEQILTNFRQLQKGIAACIISQNRKIIKLVHNLLVKLMAIFPADKPNSLSRKDEELDALYGNIAKVQHNLVYFNFKAPNFYNILGGL